MDRVRENKIPLTIAIIQWFITTILQLDRLFFTYVHENKYFMATKALYLIFLAVVWCFFFDVHKKIKAENENYKRGIFIFKFYLCIMMVLLLILWPGTWAWDDLNTLIAIARYEGWMPWQHTITGIYQDVMLQILPFPGGIILLQNIIISVCVAFAVTKLEMVFEIKRMRWSFVDGFVKVLPFLMPPVLIFVIEFTDLGEIYVYTSRNMNSYNGNIGLINKYTAVVLSAWLGDEGFWSGW